MLVSLAPDIDTEVDILSPDIDKDVVSLAPDIQYVDFQDAS